MLVGVIWQSQRGSGGVEVAQRAYYTWIDTNGFTRLTLVNSAAGAAGVLAALLAQSNADILNSLDTTLAVNASPSPVAAQFQVVSDAAALTFQDAAGSLVVIQLPAPVSSIFLADTVTVNSAAIAAIKAAVIGTVVTAAGGVVTAYVGGSRRPTNRENYRG